MPVRRIEAKNGVPDAQAVGTVALAVQQGQLVVLPTETVYGLAADPALDAGIARLCALKGRAAGQPFTHHCASPEQALALVPRLPATARRLVQRYWPGPLTLVVPGTGGGPVGLRVPAQPFTRAVLERFSAGLYLTSVNRSGAPPLLLPDAIAAAFPELDVLVDAGPPPLAESSAIVRCVGPEAEVVREGTLRRDELLAAAAATVLLVCTGNTCRSPMAAALARSKLARALGTTAERLLAFGIDVRSAGLAAWPGDPASPQAVAAMAEVGLDLTAHAAARATQELVAGSSLVLGMTRAHVAALRERAPQVRIETLDPTGNDVTDPFGQDLAAYRAARDALDAALERRLPELMTLLA